MLLEWVVAAAVLAMVALVAGTQVSGRGRRVALALGWGALTLGLAAAGHSFWGDPQRHSERSASERPLQIPDQGYVTSDACRSCHPREYATWERSFHSKMTRLATPESVLGDFDGVTLSVYGDDYHLERRGDQFWVDQPGRFEPERPKRVEKRVVMTTGSHNVQVYWMTSGKGRELELFQFVYRVPEARWIPIDANFLFPPGVKQVTEKKGIWNETCARCHTTFPRPRIGAGREMDTEVAEFGIACESCHGPAEAHIERNQKPWLRYGSHLFGLADDTIVNPAKLSAERGSQVCSQCHAIRPLAGAQAKSRYNWEGFPYRPGDDLERTRPAQFTPADRSRFWADGTSRTSGREYMGLLKTPCFRHGDPTRQMSCTSCHRLHAAHDDPRPEGEWAAHQLDVAMETNAACISCHGQLGGERALEQHTRHAADSSGSLCYNCHMPRTSYGLLKAVRSHTLESPDARVSAEVGRPNGCNLCHLNETLAWTARELEEGWGVPAPELDEEQRTRSAAVLWLLRGDAALRALVAWHMGWEPAHEASDAESGWMEPYLAQVLIDPYAANRFIAHRALTAIPEYAGVPYAPMDRALMRDEARPLALQVWRERTRAARLEGGETSISLDDAAILFEAGELDERTFRRLLSERDDTRIGLVE
jgi:hypothetical protein